MSKSVSLVFLRKLHIVAIVEAISTLVLFGIAMPLKYLLDFPYVVKIAGPVHGFLFIALVLMCCIGIRKVPLSFLWGLLGIISAIFPFGPFIFDLHLKKLARNS